MPDPRSPARRSRRPLLLIALVVFTGALAAPAASVAAPAPHPAAPADDRTHVVPGQAGGPCAGSYEVVIHGQHHSCTHPDAPPRGIDPFQRDPLATSAAATSTAVSGTAAAAPPAVPCFGDGRSGNRVQAIYAHAATQPDRFAQVAPSISTWAAAADQTFADSAAETGGTRRVRFVTDASCNLAIADVALADAAVADFAVMESALQTAGYNRVDRKYLVWMDATTYCGIGDVFFDDQPGAGNASNGGNVEFARVDNGCWGVSGQSVEAHELIHTLGGVQTSAPHSTPYNHCWDESDRLCYADGSGGPPMQQICPTSHERLLDCGHDDYFSTNPVAPNYLATHWNTANSSFLSTTDPLPAVAVGRYTPLAPARILDTRNGTGGRNGSLGAGQTMNLQVTGVGGVPATGVSAVVINVTVTAPTASGFLTIYPTGTAAPVASNLNFVVGQTVPNLAMVKVGTGGQVSIYNALGSTAVIGDVAGWYSDGTGVAPAGGLYAPVAPTRILDTRDGTGGRNGSLGVGQTMNLQVTGVGGVPVTGVSAVVINVTVTAPTAGSYLALYPTGTSLPVASNLNYLVGQTVANLVVVKVGTGGQVSIYNALGSTAVIGDVAGWYSDGNGVAPAGGLYAPVAPSRILDTRNGTGGRNGPLGAGQTMNLQVTGVGGVPATGVSAVVINVTVTAPTASGFLMLYPTGTSVPVASNLNFVVGQTVPNLVKVKVGAGGQVSIFNALGSTAVIGDVAGWFSS